MNRRDRREDSLHCWPLNVVRYATRYAALIATYLTARGRAPADGTIVAIDDSAGRDPEVSALAELEARTTGNPFYVTQLILDAHAIEPVRRIDVRSAARGRRSAGSSHCRSLSVWWMPFPN